MGKYELTDPVLDEAIITVERCITTGQKSKTKSEAQEAFKILTSRLPIVPADDKSKLEAAEFKISATKGLLNSLAYDLPGGGIGAIENLMSNAFDGLESAEGYIGTAIRRIERGGD